LQSKTGRKEHITYTAVYDTQHDQHMPDNHGPVFTAARFSAPPYTYIRSSVAISQYAILQNNSNIGVNIVCWMRQSTLDRENSGAAAQKVPVAPCTLQQAT